VDLIVVMCLLLSYSNIVDLNTNGSYGVNYLFISRQVFSEVIDLQECVMLMFFLVLILQPTASYMNSQPDMIM